MSRGGIEWAEGAGTPRPGAPDQPRLGPLLGRAQARRLQGMGRQRYANGFRVTTHEDLLKPLHWAKPRRVLTYGRPVP